MAQAELEKGDSAAASDRATAALLRIEGAPHLAGEFQLVHGSALLFQAEGAPAAEKPELFTAACAALREAERLGVDKKSHPSLQYRLALAEYRTGGNPDEVARRLENVLDDSPADRLNGYALLVQMHLNRPQPNIEAALKANERLLAQPNLVNPNPARLQRGELLLQQRRGAEARAVLARIPPTAAEYPEARHQRAWSHYGDGEWQAAIELWEPALKEGSFRLPHLPQVLYALGACYLQSGRPSQDIQAVWQRVGREAPGSDEALAASLGLAILHMHAGQSQDALVHFKAALAGMSPTWRNSYTDSDEVRALVEKAYDAWLSASEYDTARELAQLYAAIAPPGAAARRIARASREAGVKLLREAGGTDVEERKQLVSDGHKLLSAAAASYEQAARELAMEGDSLELLWLGAESYLLAQEPLRAATVLEIYLRGEIPPERRQQAQVALGEAYQALHRSADAERLLRQAGAQSGPWQPRTLYLLALAQIDQGNLAGAETTLKEMLRLPLRESTAQEPRLARAALVHLLFKREAYLEAAECLEKELEQEPRHPQRLQTSYWLAEAYRRAAREERKHISAADTSAAREFYMKRKSQQLEKALAQFQLVIAGLEKRTLPVEDQVRLRESWLGLGECLTNLGRYDDAVGAYATLLRQEQGSAAGLTAAMQLTHCYLTLRKLEEAQKTATAAQAALERLSDQDLETTGSNRRAWQDWFTNAAMSAQAKN